MSRQAKEPTRNSEEAAKTPRRRRRGLRALAWIAGVLAVLMALPYLFPLRAYDPYGEAPPHGNGQYVEIVEQTFYYRIFTPPEGTASKGRILLIHGFGGSTNSWNATAPELASQGYLVVAADLPGFGYSEKKRIVPSYTHESNAQNLWLLADLVVPVDRSVGGWILVGHSMGGGVVARMAALRPDRTARVVLVDGAVLGSGGNTGSSGFVKTLLAFPPLARAATVVIDRVLQSQKTVGNLLASAYGREPTAAERTSYAVPLAVPGTAASLITIMQGSSQDEDVTPRLKNSVRPVTLIWGSADTWVPPTPQGAEVARILDVPLRLVDGAGHCPMETHPAEFLKLLVEEIGPEVIP
jgi:pimeloyl-ACP methyl ester carboxylesterase